MDNKMNQIKILSEQIQSTKTVAMFVLSGTSYVGYAGVSFVI